MQRGACKHTEDTRGVFQAVLACRDTEKEIQVQLEHLWLMEMAHFQKRTSGENATLLDAAFESSRWALRNNTFSQPLGFLCTRQDTHRVLPFSLCL